MDFNRHKYEEQQRKKESRRKATQVVIKEMKFRPKIDVHDYTTKMRHVERFLAEGNKVKLTIMFRGREMAHPELGLRILERIADEVSEIAIVESAPRQDGRNMTMVLHPIDKGARKPKTAAGRSAGGRRRAGGRAEAAPSEAVVAAAEDTEQPDAEDEDAPGCGEAIQDHRHREDPPSQAVPLPPAREEVEQAHPSPRLVVRGHRQGQEARRAPARPRLTPPAAVGHPDPPPDHHGQSTDQEHRSWHASSVPSTPRSVVAPILEAAEGYSGSRSRHVRKANEQVMHSGQLRVPRPPGPQG